MNKTRRGQTLAACLGLGLGLGLGTGYFLGWLVGIAVASLTLGVAFILIEAVFGR